VHIGPTCLETEMMRRENVRFEYTKYDEKSFSWKIRVCSNRFDRHNHDWNGDLAASNNISSEGIT
jgi:hypothetical protein